MKNDLYIEARKTAACHSIYLQIVAALKYIDLHGGKKNEESQFSEQQFCCSIYLLISRATIFHPSFGEFRSCHRLLAYKRLYILIYYAEQCMQTKHSLHIYYVLLGSTPQVNRVSAHFSSFFFSFVFPFQCGQVLAA